MAYGNGVPSRVCSVYVRRFVVETARNEKRGRETKEVRARRSFAKRAEKNLLFDFKKFGCVKLRVELTPADRIIIASNGSALFTPRACARREFRRSW